jgi:hypothetical protein
MLTCTHTVQGSSHIFCINMAGAHGRSVPASACTHLVVSSTKLAPGTGGRHVRDWLGEWTKGAIGN